MKGLVLIGGALALAALAGCGKVSFGDPLIEQLEHCARATALHAEALERLERVDQQPEKYISTRVEGVMPALKASTRYRLLACGFDTSIIGG